MIFSHNLFRIVYYNFRFLPFKQAVHFPIDVSTRTIIKNNGRIVINAPLKRGMISIGFLGSDIFGLKRTILENKGTLQINGGGIRIGTGSSLAIYQGGRLDLYQNVSLGANTLLLCENQIVINENTCFSWDCQIMDTDTHSIKDLETGKFYNRYLPIFIGANVWGGNHLIINKGTKIPQGTIIASLSLCNKDYLQLIPENSLIAGIPAVLKKTGVTKSGDKI